MKVVENIADLIGNTPLAHIWQLRAEGEADIYAKLEYLNPGGSVKDRTALGLISAAEKSGELKPGGTIVEGTAGNTGVGLALVGRAKGYKVIIVMAEGYAREKMFLVRGLGATLRLVPKQLGLAGAVEEAQRIVKTTPGAVLMNQFDNPANPLIHYNTTAPEIWQQLDGRVDGIAIGSGTGGTFSGLARFFKEKNAQIRCHIVEPPNSILGGGSGAGVHRVEGIGAKWWPKALDKSLLDGIYTVPHKESYSYVDKLGALGYLVAGASGASFAGAKRLAKELGPGKNVITVFSDPAERYFSKYVYDGLYEGQEFND